MNINYGVTSYGENISMTGADFETIIDRASPTGIDLYENYLVSDYSNGDIIVYDLTNENGIQESPDYEDVI